MKYPNDIETEELENVDLNFAILLTSMNSLNGVLWHMASKGWWLAGQGNVFVCVKKKKFQYKIIEDFLGILFFIVVWVPPHLGK